MKCDICDSEKGVKTLIGLHQTPDVKNLCSACRKFLYNFMDKHREATIKVFAENNILLHKKYKDKMRGLKMRCIQIGYAKEEHKETIKAYYEGLK